ncbi:hypothetical protein Anas_01951 [Armadillidium nasatum]|uniref:SH2 domain-containing protein n=1 Tax=Armadillidium nasatum TaxID=96803 RepID=A0A5N5TJE5_9CRUS|nr:hypothetical protein Anas_01951 [Armadillidium nasatum]
MSLPFYDDVKHWSVEQLAAWLKQKEMPDIADIYLRKGVDGHKFITLDEGEHIAILNSLSLRSRLDFLNIIKKIKRQQSNYNGKTPLQKPSNSYNNNGYRKPAQISTHAHLPADNQRLGSPPRPNSSDSSLNGENDLSESFNTSIDKTSNEDYLVPLSTGLGSIGLDQPSIQVKTNKARCPSPPFSSSKMREKNNIQNLELPRPPNDLGMNFSSVNSQMKTLMIKEMDPQLDLANDIENKEDLNAYEIIQENPDESDSRIHIDNQASAPPPVVPIRTHSSSQRPSFHRPPPTPSAADPLTNITSSSLQKLMKSVTQNSVNISSKSKTLMETSSRSHIPLPSVDVLVLGENKSVPMNNLYKSLLDKPYFHAVTRNSLSNMLVEDGMYLVRPSTHSEHLLTLSIANNHKIFNIVIRKRDDSKFALGTQKAGEMSFFSVDEMVKFYHREAIKVEDGSLVYLKKLPYKDRN